MCEAHLFWEGVTLDCGDRSLAPSPGTPGRGLGVRVILNWERFSKIQITLTLTLSRNTGRGNRRKNFIQPKTFCNASIWLEYPGSPSFTAKAKKRIC